MTITTSTLTRAAGVSAVVSRLLFIVIQPIHPRPGRLANLHIRHHDHRRQTDFHLQRPTS